MINYSTNERRAITRMSTEAGGVLIVAADQRNSMKAVMNHPDGAASISTEELRNAKFDLVRFLGNAAPAILLDPEVAVPQVIDEDVLSRDTALVVGMDASGYETVSGLRYTKYVDGVSVTTVKRLGGDLGKMLFYLRPDVQPFDSRVGKEMRELVQESAREDVLTIIEILTYRLDGEEESEYRSIFPRLVADSAHFAVECGAKFLKLPYPGSAAACAAVTEAAQGVPWAVLSAGVDFETFVEQVDAAVSAGAIGAMAGRALWKDALDMSSEQREQKLGTLALPRLRTLESTINSARKC